MKILRDYDTAELEVQEIIHRTTHRDKVKIWVEGNDWRLYGRFFNEEIVDRVGRHGGYSCHSAIESYNEYKKSFPDRLAIVIRDADFHRANNKDIDSENDIFYADCHDHEMMCIHQDNVRHSLMSNFEVEEAQDDFFRKIFDELRLLSYLKWYNFNFGCGYIFTSLGNLFEIDIEILRNLDELETEIYDRTRKIREKKGIQGEVNRIGIDALKQFIVSRLDVDQYELINGHDFYSRIRYHIQQSNRSYQRNEGQLKDGIYSAFETSFTNTNLYKRLCQWCVINNQNIMKVL